MNDAPSLHALLTQGRFLLHDADHEFLHFIPITHEMLNQSPFLDHRLSIPAHTTRYRVGLQEALAEAGKLGHPLHAPSRYLLHVSHVGSTLVSRVLGLSPAALALREPVPLRFLAEQRLLHDDGLGLSSVWLSPREHTALKALALHCLNRPVEGRQAITIKCSSWVNVMADELLAAVPAARVVGISVAPEAFLANTLRSEAGLRDIHGMAPARLRRLQRLLPGFCHPLHAFDAASLSAMSWLTEMLSIQRAAASSGAVLRWLDFDEFLNHPAASAEVLAHHLLLPWGSREADALHKSGLMTRYAKREQGEPYSAATRQHLLATFSREHAGSLQRGLNWLQETLLAHPPAREALTPWFARRP